MTTMIHHELEAHGDFAADEVALQLRGHAIGHVRHLHARELLEERAREVLPRHFRMGAWLEKAL